MLFCCLRLPSHRVLVCRATFQLDEYKKEVLLLRQKLSESEAQNRQNSLEYEKELHDVEVRLERSTVRRESDQNSHHSHTLTRCRPSIKPS